jgi:uncharacterized protein (TIGR02246 family)
MKLSSALILLAVLVAPFPLAGQVGDSASVSAFYGRWFGAAPKGMAAYAEFYAPDGLMLPPNAPPQRGREAIAAWMTLAQAARPYAIQPEGLTVDEMRFLGPDWVLHRTSLRGKRVPKAGGAPTPFETKYLDILHRTADGWEVVSRMWSDNQ